MLVHSTAGRAETRRSTSGDGTRSSIRPHTANSTAAAMSRPMTRGLPQPHSVPLEIASSRQTSAAPRPAAPGRSKRPPERVSDSGEEPAHHEELHRAEHRGARRTASASSRAARPDRSAGSPIAPPMPSDELISAMPLPTRPAGRTSRMMLMPSGTTPSEAPCSTRATISTSTPGATAPERGARRDQRERDEQHPALAVHVPEPAQQRCAHRARHEGGRHQPGHGGGRCAEQLRELRQQWDDQGLGQRDGETARGEHADDERGTGDGGGHPIR